MTSARIQIAERSPLAAFPFIHRSHGLQEVNQNVFVQDIDGRIKHVHINGSRDETVVDLDRKPSINTGFAVTGWGGGIYSNSNLRLYYTNTSGQIFERCYTGSRGSEWYDGALTGQFKAAPNSQLAALASENGGLTWVYYQDPDTDQIRTLFRSNSGAGFSLNHATSGSPAALKGTSIAASTSGNSGVFYQLPDLTIIQEGGLPQSEKFKTKFEHPAGASIAVTGNIVFTVTAANKIAATVYDSETHTWKPSVEIAEVMPLAPLTANSHGVPRGKTHEITLFTQRIPHDLAEVAYTDVDNVVIGTA